MRRRRTWQARGRGADGGGEPPAAGPAAKDPPTGGGCAALLCLPSSFIRHVRSTPPPPPVPPAPTHLLHQQEDLVAPRCNVLLNLVHLSIDVGASEQQGALPVSRARWLTPRGSPAHASATRPAGPAGLLASSPLPHCAQTHVPAHLQRRKVLDRLWALDDAEVVGQRHAVHLCKLCERRAAAGWCGTAAEGAGGVSKQRRQQ